MSDRWAAEAQYLLANDLLNETLDGMERDAIERVVNAPPADDETRRIGSETVRAIRQFRSDLTTRLGEAGNRRDRSGVV